jgi:hypothetical protein
VSHGVEAACFIHGLMKLVFLHLWCALFIPARILALPYALEEESSGMELLEALLFSVDLDVVAATCIGIVGRRILENLRRLPCRYLCVDLDGSTRTSGGFVRTREA